MCSTSAPRSTATPDIDLDSAFGDKIASSPAPIPDGTDQTTVVDRLLGHEHMADGTYYRFSLFNWFPADGILQPPADIPQHVVARYWNPLGK